MNLQEYIAAEMERRNAAIEMMCERMLVLDSGGVLVETYANGQVVTLTKDVPWGEVHYWNHLYEEMP